jgi:hypothetical protein
MDQPSQPVPSVEIPLEGVPLELEGIVLEGTTSIYSAKVDAEDEEWVRTLGPWYIRDVEGWRLDKDDWRSRSWQAYTYGPDEPDHCVHLHDFIMGPGGGEEAFPVNGDGLDCRRSNLRIRRKPVTPGTPAQESEQDSEPPAVYCTKAGDLTIEFRCVNNSESYNAYLRPCDVSEFGDTGRDLQRFDRTLDDALKYLAEWTTDRPGAGRRLYQQTTKLITHIQPGERRVPYAGVARGLMEKYEQDCKR